MDTDALPKHVKSFRRRQKSVTPFAGGRPEPDTEVCGERL